MDGHVVCSPAVAYFKFGLISRALSTISGGVS
jgi:hypothetical protein